MHLEGLVWNEMSVYGENNASGASVLEPLKNQLSSNALRYFLIKYESVTWKLMILKTQR